MTMTKKGTNQQQWRFPQKLHSLLERADCNKDSISHNGNIISWTPDGKSFLIHDQDRFVKELLPDFFGHANFKTFQRNLNLWGFTRISKGPHKGETSHPLFLRGFPLLCQAMKRVVVKGTGRGNRAPRDGISIAMGMMEDTVQAMFVSDAPSVSSSSASTSSKQCTPQSLPFSYDATTSNSTSLPSSMAVVEDNAHPYNRKNNDAPAGVLDGCMTEKLATLIQLLHGPWSSTSCNASLPTTHSSSSILSAYQCLFATSPQLPLQPKALPLPSLLLSLLSTPPVSSDQDRWNPLVLLHQQQLLQQQQQQPERSLLQQLFQQIRLQEEKQQQQHFCSAILMNDLPLQQQ